MWRKSKDNYNYKSENSFTFTENSSTYYARSVYRTAADIFVYDAEGGAGNL